MPRPSAAPSPFLKWAGGKRQLLPRILRGGPRARWAPTTSRSWAAAPSSSRVVGARAALRARRPGRRERGADPLLPGHPAGRGRPSSRALRPPQVRSRRSTTRCASAIPATLSDAGRAARLIYLNRCGYNGLYRVNRSGRFNVPFGRYKDPVICDAPKLRAAAARARRACELVHGDFEKTLRGAQAAATSSTSIRPYVPLSATSSFTAYAKTPFDGAAQARLAAALRELGARRVHALLSNSDCARDAAALRRRCRARRCPCAAPSTRWPRAAAPSVSCS